MPNDILSKKEEIKCTNMIKGTKNSINKKDSKCFQYAVTVAFNHEKTKKDSQRITKIKPFINKYK